MKCTIIGGGIIGLSSAHYLRQSGWEVTVIDRSDFQNNCSYGNAGYVCPSHFIPLASPGIISQGLRWMLDKNSPFYIQPRIDWGLINWGLKFMAKANSEHVAYAAEPLRDIALLSQQLYEDLARSPRFEFGYDHRGLMEYTQTPEGLDHAKHTVEKALELGLEAEFMDEAEAQSLEPHLRMNVNGGIKFKCDAHLYPNQLMHSLLANLEEDGVNLRPNENFKSIEKQGDQIRSVRTDKASYDTDLVVLATGSWSREVGKLMGLNIPLVGGRGYSITLEDSPYRMNFPSILSEGKVAITPLDQRHIRFGGTMEITGTGAPPQPSRVQGILNSVRKFIPDWEIPMPKMEEVWYGYRPCSADGLPYIDRVPQWQNCIVATGHSMLGISLGAGTGKLVSELANEQATSIPVEAYRLARF
ncbi:NAD(P)/FAD-dependent oxidoreductase [Flavilitoribacter nigricans]|uniref:FAD-dependent oxidoreductase n=1 Tax=Flavilitoribacter nigricans (strain ATCC 23147 / DSM 23189 / NBRC 102662 / NCIMB 1420 / SS-2) TaxID=1122177 RepID=A0A2D0NF54_FLAN2|nr:FAD-dependent oxidoreductase [Flavilitoribacter nigricans]PHN06413.1 FAD-dependent oxidoreductase [Flavilitoribacter nigricans DSM 23189 = NBRC 102662]